DTGHQGTLGRIEAKAFRDVLGDRLDAHTEPATPRLTELDQLVDDIFGKLRRNGETDTDRAAGRRDDRRIDADDLALHVEQRPAGIALVDGGIRLDEIVVGAGIDIASARRDDPNRQRAAETERIADGHHPVADPHGAGIPEA